MKTKIKARKKTIIKWINEKFGSLAMLAGVAGVDTSAPGVRSLLDQVVTSREPVILSLKWRDIVIEVSFEHHLSGKSVNAKLDLSGAAEAASSDPTEPFGGE